MRDTETWRNARVWRNAGVWRNAEPWLARLTEAAHLMVGLPDYRRYVAHRQARHPGEPVMTRQEFVQDRLERRFGGKTPGRCC